jgi:hypothetical protein
VPYPSSFRIQYPYDPLLEGVTLPVSLSSGTGSVRLFAKVDTGASYCMFERGVAEILSIDVEKGTPIRISSVGGPFRAYAHDLSLEVLGLKSDAVVYFYEDRSAGRNVLGRSGWLNRVRLALVDHDSLIYLNSYDD